MGLTGNTQFFADLTGSSFDKWSIDGMKKPFGLSHFPYEHGAPPRSWAESTGKVSFFRSHDKVSTCVFVPWPSIDARKDTGAAD